MTLDRELVTRKLLLIAADLEPLREIQAKGVADFLSNRLEQAVVERLLERAITRMIDINYHLITALGQPPPADYYSSFVQLGTLGVLSGDVAVQMARAAGLRNRLVHEYEDLDTRMVFDAIAFALHDVPIYLSRIREQVNRQP